MENNNSTISQLFLHDINLYKADLKKFTTGTTIAEKAELAPTFYLENRMLKDGIYTAALTISDMDNEINEISKEIDHYKNEYNKINIVDKNKIEQYKKDNIITTPQGLRHEAVKRRIQNTLDKFSNANTKI